MTQYSRGPWDKLSDLNPKTPTSSSCRNLQGQGTFPQHPLGIPNTAALQKPKSDGHFFLKVRNYALSKKKNKKFMANIVKLWKLVISTISKAISQIMQRKLSAQMDFLHLNISFSISASLLYGNLWLKTHWSPKTERFTSGEGRECTKDNLSLISFAIWSKENKNMC